MKERANAISGLLQEAMEDAYILATVCKSTNSSHHAGCDAAAGLAFVDVHSASLRHDPMHRVAAAAVRGVRYNSRTVPHCRLMRRAEYAGTAWVSRRMFMVNATSVDFM